MRSKYKPGTTGEHCIVWSTKTNHWFELLAWNLLFETIFLEPFIGWFCKWLAFRPRLHPRRSSQKHFFKYLEFVGIFFIHVQPRVDSTSFLLVTKLPKKLYVIDTLYKPITYAPFLVFVKYLYRYSDHSYSYLPSSKLELLWQPFTF